MQNHAPKNSKKYHEKVLKYSKNEKEKIKNKNFDFEGLQVNEIDLSEIDIDGDLILSNSKIDKVILKRNYVKGNIRALNAEIGEISFNDTTVVGDIILYGNKIEKLEINAAAIKGEIAIDYFDEKSEEKSNIGEFNINDTDIESISLEHSIINSMKIEYSTIKEEMSLLESNINNLNIIDTIIGYLDFSQDTKISKLKIKHLDIKTNIYAQDLNIKELVINGLITLGNMEFSNSCIEIFSLNGAMIRGRANLKTLKIDKQIKYIDSMASLLEIGDANHSKLFLSKIKDNTSQENIYRNLKTTYESLGRKKIADEYFYMEMKVKRSAKSIIKRFFEWFIADLTCKYGTDWKRPVALWLVTVLLFFPFLYFIIPFILNIPTISSIQGGTHTLLENIHNFLESIYFSIVTATTLGYGDLHPLGVGKIIATIEAIFGTGMWAIFLAVFARKFMR